jgi:hypothetical protein
MVGSQSLEKQKEKSEIDLRFEKLVAAKWFRVIVFIYLMISAAGFPLMIFLYYCHFYR